MLRPNLKPCLKRPRYQSSDDSNQSQPSNTSTGSSSSAKRSKSHHQRVQWDITMRDVSDSSGSVTRSHPRDQHFQRHITMRDSSDSPSPVTRSHARNQHFQQDVPRRDVSSSPGPVTRSHARNQHFQQDVPMRNVSSSPGLVTRSHAKNQHFQQDVPMRDVSSSPGPVTRSHARNQHFQQDVPRRDVSSSPGPVTRSHARNLHFQQDVPMRNVSSSPGPVTRSHAKNQHFQQDVARRDVSSSPGPVTRSRDGNQHIQSSRTVKDAFDNGLPGHDGPHTAAVEKYCKQLLSRIYFDIHAASLPGVIEATTDLKQHVIQEHKQFSVQNWVKANFALQTRSIYKVIEYAVAGQELYNNHRLVADVYVAVNSVALEPDHGLGRARLVATADTRLAFRYSDFASAHGFMMLSILATSAAFREAARTLDEAIWKSVGRFIRANYYSLEYFAKIRGLRWQLALNRIPQFQQVIQPHLKERCPGIESAHPHTYVVPRPQELLRRPRYKGQDQINIDDNIYLAETFAKYEAPRNWPVDLRYPSDPTLSKMPCHICGKRDCACDTLDCDRVTKPLVEIVDCGEKGNGIRLLQPIKRGDILDEYVGEIKSTQVKLDDTAYSLCLDVGYDNTVAFISSQFKGNWTRFINHSCRASAKFQNIVIGRRLRSMIVAVRNVDIFEELTIDYGLNYWEGSRQLCKCHEPNCRYNTWHKVQRKRAAK